MLAEGIISANFPMKDQSVDSDKGASSANSSSLSGSLLLKLRQQDSQAWQRLVALVGPLVYSWCRRAGLQAEDAADVGQEVFRAVAAHIGDFRRERPSDSFRGWLWTITRNKIRDFWRRREGRPEAAGGTAAQQALLQVPLEESASLSDSSPHEGTTGLLQRALQLIQEEFAERTWQAFWRVTIEERAPAEVAAELGMSVGAVYIAKSRVLGRLREEFGDFLDEG